MTVIEGWPEAGHAIYGFELTPEEMAQLDESPTPASKFPGASYSFMCTM